jgi:hypothetical protein
MPDKKPITFRPSDDASECLKLLLQYYRKEFQGISQADVINKALIELYEKVVRETK